VRGLTLTGGTHTVGVGVRGEYTGAAKIAARVVAFSPPRPCHFVAQGVLPLVAVLGCGFYSPCPCVAFVMIFD